MKNCIKCNQLLDLSEFYKHADMGDGHLNKCKSCAKKEARDRREEKMKDADFILSERARSREKMRKLRASGGGKTSESQHKVKNKNYAAKWPKKYKAVTLSRRIPSQPCEVCGSPNSQRHHDDYDKPMEVRFLCPKHHSEHHVKMRELTLEVAR